MWRFFVRHTARLRLNTRVVRRTAYLVLSIVLLFGWCISIANAQSVQVLHGEILDEQTHLPVPSASIRILNTSFASITDQFGHFDLTNLPAGEYDVIIQADSYQPDTIHNVIIILDQPTTLSVQLEPIAYELPSIEVRDSLNANPRDGRIVLTKTDIKQSHVNSLSQLLSTVPGIIVQESGPQQVTVSLRGGEKRHLVILLDGQKLNTSGDNIANLASIPLSLIEQIEIIPGGNSAESGSGAIAGVIAISTHSNKQSEAHQLAIRQGFGSWNGKWYEAIADNPVPLSPVSYRFSYSHQGVEGDFPFNYQVAPRPTVYSGVRENNAVSADNYFLSSEAVLSSHTTLNVSGQYYDAASGLPGKASDQNIIAKRSDTRKNLTSQFHTELSPKVDLSVAVGLSRLQQHFTNLESGATGFETDYINDLYHASVETALHPFAKTDFHLGLETQLDEVDGRDVMRPAYSLGTANRIAEAGFLSARQRISLGINRYLHPLTLDAAIRYDHARTENGELFTSDGDSLHTTEQWSPEIGAGIGFGSALQVTLHGSYGRSFSLPDLYSLFWKGMSVRRGTYLRPEQAEHSDINLQLAYTHHLVSINTSVSYFHSSIHDLIVWLAGYADVWRPENIAGARITGTEQSATIKFDDDFFTVSVSNTNILPLNRTPGANSFNKDLTYRPRSLTKLSARVSKFGLYASYAIRWVDRSYALSSNTKWYDAYRLDDLAVGEHTVWQQWNLHADVRIDNLRNVSYVLVQHYPMPGREWQMRIGIDYLIKSNHTENKSRDK